MSDVFPPMFAAVSSLLFFHRRSLRYLQYFQQEEYDWKRFVAWYRRRLAFDRRGTIVCLLACLGTLVLEHISSPLLTTLGWLVGAAALVIVPRQEENPRTTGKIPVNVTERARRIWHVATVLFGSLAFVALLACLMVIGSQYISVYWLLLIFFIQSTPLILIIANRLLSRYEKSRRRKLLDEAQSVLSKVNPLVVGITGSYGKTNTKAILRVFLESCGPTFWPPQSINSILGVARAIRENLKLGHRFAVLEIGAYRIGSIQRFCALIPPQVGIITCIGMMHLERFGSLAAIYEAKSELARAVPEGGILVCNGDNPGSRRIATEFPKEHTILYGLDVSAGPLDCWASHVEVSPSETSFSIHWRGNVYEGSTKLLGRLMLANLLAAFATACALGVHPAVLIAQARNLQPQPHRLELKKNAGVLTIDDTYNSNPVGFAEALEILKTQPGRRKILVTPGMVELGELQESENRRLATLAAAVCDLVLIVGDTNRRAFTEGLREGGTGEEQVKFFPHRDLARAYLTENTREGDVVLWENDLPDVYEGSPTF